METSLKLSRTEPTLREDRGVAARPQSHTRMRIVRGDAGPTETFVLDVPSVQVMFQHQGLPTRTEWRCADSASENCCPSDAPRTRGETAISFDFEEPGASRTTVRLAGLVVVDSGGEHPRRIEPYELTNVMHLGNAFSTTDKSVISYRVFDRLGSPAGIGMTHAAASFVADTCFRLFFRYTDEARRPGRISIFADA